jgi:hypothetical protein
LGVRRGPVVLNGKDRRDTEGVLRMTGRSGCAADVASAALARSSVSSIFPLAEASVAKELSITAVSRLAEALVDGDTDALDVPTL